jgi:hypothetical protein
VIMRRLSGSCGKNECSFGADVLPENYLDRRGWSSVTCAISSLWQKN